MTPQVPVKRSAISTSILEAGAKSVTEALPQEIFHNLQYQHGWTDLVLHSVDTSGASTTVGAKRANSPLQTSGTSCVKLISGLPPRHTYLHPDFLNHLVLNKLEQSDVPIQREWVLPMSTGETWTLGRFASIFDTLPARATMEGKAGFKHHDAKRIVCAMKARDGLGGDGTIVYYIMQEGEIKPRQN